MNRRTMLKNAMTGIGAMVAGPVLAEQCKLVLTPAQTPGPFYPKTRVTDQNSDLVKIEGSAEEATGIKIILYGKIIDDQCQPVGGVLVDLWQACHTGKYDHPRDPNPAELDPHFQYSAQVITAVDGTFNLRTIIPGAYPADTDWVRPPHIHFRIAKLGYKELVTQTYFSNFKELNEKDLILQSLNKEEQNTVIVNVRERVFSDTIMGGVDLAGDLVIAIQKVRTKV